MRDCYNPTEPPISFPLIRNFVFAFEFFDPDGDLRITHGQLPHWYQPGATYFVTFRTDDSLPVAATLLLERQRTDWLQRHHIDLRNPHWKSDFDRLPEAIRKQFQDEFNREYHLHLDKGYGKCELRNRDLALLVADCLWFFDGQRYELGDFVVMPNHVHLLASLYPDIDIEAQCYSWKKNSATMINKRLGVKGRFWQSESFDHLVRNANQFEYFRRYIADNGKNARLPPSDYFHWKHGSPKTKAT